MLELKRKNKTILKMESCVVIISDAGDEQPGSHIYQILK